VSRQLLQLMAILMQLWSKQHHELLMMASLNSQQLTGATREDETTVVDTAAGDC